MEFTGSFKGWLQDVPTEQLVGQIFRDNTEEPRHKRNAPMMALRTRIASNTDPEAFYRTVQLWVDLIRKKYADLDERRYIFTPMSITFTDSDRNPVKYVDLYRRLVMGDDFVLEERDVNMAERMIYMSLDPANPYRLSGQDIFILGNHLAEDMFDNIGENGVFDVGYRVGAAYPTALYLAFLKREMDTAEDSYQGGDDYGEVLGFRLANIMINAMDVASVDYLTWRDANGVPILHQPGRFEANYYDTGFEPIDGIPFHDFVNSALRDAWADPQTRAILAFQSMVISPQLVVDKLRAYVPPTAPWAFDLDKFLHYLRTVDLAELHHASPFFTGNITEEARAEALTHISALGNSIRNEAVPDTNTRFLSLRRSAASITRFFWMLGRIPTLNFYDNIDRVENIAGLAKDIKLAKMVQDIRASPHDVGAFMHDIHQISKSNDAANYAVFSREGPVFLGLTPAIYKKKVAGFAVYRDSSIIFDQLIYSRSVDLMLEDIDQLPPMHFKLMANAVMFGDSKTINTVARIIEKLGDYGDEGLGEWIDDVDQLLEIIKANPRLFPDTTLRVMKRVALNA